MTPTREEFLFMGHPGFKVAFYGLTFLSIGIMLWQIFGRARLWNKGRKIDWKIKPIEGIGKYILGQRKVVSSRPKTAAPMHLFIFYGFLGLLLATTLLAISTYGPKIGLPHFHQGTYYLIYESTFEVAGLLFLVGIGWAFLRRYRMTQELGEPVLNSETGKLERSVNPATSDWKDFAALGVLWMLGFTGFLLEAARISSDPQTWDGASFIAFGMAKVLPGLSPTGYVAVWWFHMIWVWAFFITLPQMRLKHILVATFTAAATPERPIGQLPSAKLDEDGIAAGAAFAKDYSKWHLMSLDACMSCGRCTEVCPAYGSGKILNPKQVVQDIHRSLTTGDGIAATVSEEALWACTTCNACVEACPVLIRHVDLIVDGRRNLVAEGKLSGTPTVVLRQMESTNSAWGQAVAQREDWMKGLEIPLAREKQDFEYLYWVGCAGATDPGAIKTTKAFAHLMKKGGVNFACLGAEEACTGDPARRLGDENTFQSKAGINAETFRKYGVSKVVTTCPHCLNTLKNEYSELGLELEVWHHTQLLEHLVKNGKIQPARPANGDVTYHDPCYLARVNDISDAPRAIVGQASDEDANTNLMWRELMRDPNEVTVFAEPQHRGRKTLCCGAGGGRMWMEEEPGQRPSERRTKELLATGAKTVAVSCPFCRIMLDASIKQETDEEIKLVDLAELLQEANQ
ncbi:MAG: (Fe-S)-binding protein [Armatimonadetes bacterium]|nr:(Fe-S)-binding protein [Armatimonadota bacterium]